MTKKTKTLKIKIPQDFYWWLELEMNMHSGYHVYGFPPLKKIEEYIVDRFISCCRQSSHRNRDSVYITASDLCRQSRMAKPEMRYFNCKCCKDIGKDQYDQIMRPEDRYSPLLGDKE